ncbi:MAG: hypothetical protein FK732_01900, partial [Asgard group archaeon]|nr:hypothetical protein [Asgard group archaeon]
MDKNKFVIFLLPIILCSLIFGGIYLYLAFVPRCSTTCVPELAYTSHSQPNNSTNHFSINVKNFGLAEAVIRNITAFRFTNSSDTYYSIKAFGNGTEISFPFAIGPLNEVNITLELDWYFTVGSQYVFTLEYGYGKS